MCVLSTYTYYMYIHIFQILSLKFVRTIPHHPYKLVSPNLARGAKNWLRYLFFSCYFVVVVFVGGCVCVWEGGGRLFHSLNPLHVYWSRQPMVIRRLMSLVLWMSLSMTYSLQWKEAIVHSVPRLWVNIPWRRLLTLQYGSHYDSTKLIHAYHHTSIVQWDNCLLNRRDRRAF